ncbi:hypothetical protein [Streptomyces decoyicus]|uniref:hypothetical protein n=1 Tax=Streptomyces decoyicus TaxID=249567 RepID=UPI003826AA29
MRNRIPMGSGCVKGSPELPDRRIPRDGSVIGAPGVPVPACRLGEEWLLGVAKGAVAAAEGLSRRLGYAC